MYYMKRHAPSPTPHKPDIRIGLTSGAYSIAAQTTANLRSVSTCAPPVCSIASANRKFAPQTVETQIWWFSQFTLCPKNVVFGFFLKTEAVIINKMVVA